MKMIQTMVSLIFWNICFLKEQKLINPANLIRFLKTKVQLQTLQQAKILSTRVMATCGLVGQAAGTAAAIAVRHGTTPRGVYEEHLSELQQTLMDDDCFLPGLVRDIPALARKARLTASAGDPEPLRNGIDRPIGDDDNAFDLPLGGEVAYSFDAPTEVAEARFVFDSDLARLRESKYNIRSNYAIKYERQKVPDTLVRDFRVETQDTSGAWSVLAHVTDNHRRLVRVPVGAQVSALRLVPERLWGDKPTCRVFAFDLR